MNVIIVFNGLGKCLHAFICSIRKGFIHLFYSFCSDHNGLELKRIGVVRVFYFTQRILYALFQITYR
jgi:hypothetical protein